MLTQIMARSLPCQLPSSYLSFRPPHRRILQDAAGLSDNRLFLLPLLAHAISGFIKDNMLTPR
jgi:hypothetical protein